MCMGGCYFESDEDREAVKEVLSHVKDNVSDEIKSYAIDKVFIKSRYLFVTQSKGKYLAYCSHCNETYEVEKLKHNTKTYCCKCNSECKVKLTRYRRKNLIDKACFIYYGKSMKDSNSIVANGFYAERDYSGDFEKVETKFTKQAVYVFSPGSSRMIVKEWRNWRNAKSIYSFNNNSLASYQYSISYKSVEEAVKSTSFKYSMWEEYVGSDMLRFFELYSKYPTIEYLTKLGFKNLVDMKIHGERMLRCINWRGKTIYKMLRVGKKDLKDIRNSEVYVTPLFLKLYQKSIEDKTNLDPKAIKEIERVLVNEYYYTKLEQILNYSDLNKVYKYIKKQENYKMSDYSNIISTWYDYIQDCKKLNMNLSDKSILYPKNLVNAHKNTIRQVKYQEDENLNKKIQDRLKNLNPKYCFEYKDLIIRPAVSSLELLNEGKTLKHCVAGYSNDYALGKTNILLIRRKGELKKPFFTMEVNNKGGIVQVHGKQNCNPTEEVKEFIEAFKHMKLKDKKIRLTA